MLTGETGQTHPCLAGIPHERGGDVCFLLWEISNFCFALVQLKVLRAGAPFLLHTQISFSALHEENKDG